MLKNGFDKPWSIIWRKYSLVERYGQYTSDYDTDTSVKRIKTLRNNVVSNTAVWIINYGWFTIEWCVFTWNVRCPLSHVILAMWLPLNTEFYEGYSTENDVNTAVYDTVSTRVTNHPGVVHTQCRWGRITWDEQDGTFGKWYIRLISLWISPV